MELFNISLTTVMIRFYLMMAVVIIGLFTGLNWMAFLALPLFLSIMLGATFKTKKATKAAQIKDNQKNIHKAAA